MAHSLELRVPLVDVPLLREVVSLGDAGQTPGKHDLFRTASPPLPEAILHRQKTGFGIPVYDWFRNQDNRATQDRMYGSRAWARRTYSQFFPAKQGGGS
jgi:asparagine synthase (glutamine-hydrolysing)